MKRLSIFCCLLTIWIAGAVQAQGTPVLPYMSTWIRTLFDDETQGAAQTTLGLGTGDTPTWAGAIITNCVTLGSDSAVFQPNADQPDFFQVKNAAGTVVLLNIDTTNNQVTVKLTSETYPFIIEDTTGNQIKLYSHGVTNNSYMKWTDGRLIFMTDEGTNTNTILSVEGKGTGNGSWRAYDQDSSEYVQLRAVSGFGYVETGGSSPKAIRLQYNAHDCVTFFENAAAGETPAIELYGYRTGDAKRNLNIQISDDDDDTVFFDNVGNYEFRDGTFALRNTTHSDADGARNIALDWRGEQSGGERSTLVRIEAGHDGTGDDEKGYLDLFINDGDDGDSPTKVMRFDSLGAVFETGPIFLKETTTPTARTNYAAIYTTSDNELFWQDGAGTEHLLHGDSFSEIWYHGISTVEVAIAAQNAFAIIDSFTVVGHEDDLLNLVGSSATNNLTLSSIAGGEYEISYHGSITATGGADKVMMFNVGITLATPKDITNVTDDTVTPIVITSVAHGLENGDMVQIAGVLVNLAANGSFIVDSKANDTFVIVKLDYSATTGNGDYDEGTPTGDVTILYPGGMVIKTAVRGTDLDAISATGLHILANSDVLALYIANISGATNLTVDAVSLDATRIGD